jgi:hypothetical protein
MRQSTVTADHAPDAVQRLGGGIEGAWRWWVNEGAHSHTTSALIELGLVLLLTWCVSWAVRLEIDRAKERARKRHVGRLRVRITEQGMQRLAVGQEPPPAPPMTPPAETREDPGS